MNKLSRPITIKHVVSYQLTRTDLPVTINTININDVIVHTRMAESTSSLSLIDLYQLDFSAFATTFLGVSSTSLS